MNYPKNGEGSNSHGRSAAQDDNRSPSASTWNYVLPSGSRSNSRRESEIIELGGESEDGQEDEDWEDVVIDYRSRVALPKKSSARDLSHRPKSRPRPSRPDVIHDSHEEEVEERLERGNPPRKPARHKQGESTPINDVPTASTPIVIDLAHSSPPSLPFPSPEPAHYANNSALSPPSDLESAVPASPDYQDEVLAALDLIYDGGRQRVAMREHEMFHLLVHVHIPKDHMTLMLTWERNRYQYGDMVFTRQIEYLTRYIEQYGELILRYDGRTAMSLHFTRLYNDNRLCPAWQATSDKLTDKQRIDILGRASMDVLLEISKRWNTYCKARGHWPTPQS